MSFFKPPIEIDAPDISPYRDGNTGIDYVWSFASDAPGPHVVIIGLTHGNEICGAIALDHLLRAGIRPIKGRLTFIFANVAAYQTFNRYDPSAARYLDEDLNRVWDRAVLDGPRTSSELQRARAILPVIDTADLLLDIHSMTHASMPLMLTGMEEKHLAFARRVGLPSLLVRDAGHASGPRLRDYARFADPALPTIALLAECGHHWSRDTVDVAIATTWRFLAASGVLTEHEAAQHRGPEAPPQQSVLVTHRITAESDAFRFTEDYRGLEVIARAGTIIARDGTKTIQTPYDDCVLIMPTRRFVRGQTAVRLGRFED
jgi:predicted deacylase